MGERQRAAISRALAASPGLLVADEPTDNPGSERSDGILAVLRDVAHDRGIAALIVTHDAATSAFVDRVGTLRDGRLYHDGVVEIPSTPARS
jgi:ABC-type lipoprotein export system ATPase subunit